MSDQMSEGPLKYLPFILEGEQLALPLSKVRAIVHFHLMTTVPFAPKQVQGVVHFKGRIVSVVDLRPKIKDHPAGNDSPVGILVLDLSALWIGIVADQVGSMISILPSEVQSVSDQHPIPALGQVSREGKTYLIVDIEKLLGIEAVTYFKKGHQTRLKVG